MTDVQAGIMIGLFSVIVACYAVGGICIALEHIGNRHVPTPKNYHEYKYNWFGSWVVFISKTFLAAPFYIIFTICIIVRNFLFGCSQQEGVITNE